jgi:hypothetical protein
MSKSNPKVFKIPNQLAIHILNPLPSCRRYQDMEGWTADVTQLRKTLTSVDRKLHEMRLVERCAFMAWL